LHDSLLNYLSISFQENASKESAILKAQQDLSEKSSPTPKFLYSLFPEEKQVLLYNIEDGSAGVHKLKVPLNIPSKSVNLYLPQKNYFFIFGGIDPLTKQISQSSLLCQVDKGYDVLAPMPFPKIHCGTCYIDDCIYFFGGRLQSGQITNLCEKFSIKKNL